MQIVSGKHEMRAEIFGENLFVRDDFVVRESGRIILK